MVEMRQRASTQAHSIINGSVDNTKEGDSASKAWARAKGKKLKEEYRLLDFHALPEYLKDNEYILAYYRADFSFSQSLSSLFRMHNETINIWTHLLGFLLFIGFTIFAVLELRELSSTISTCLHGMWQENITSEYCALPLMKENMAKMVSPVLNRTTRWPFYVFLGGSMFCLLASTICHLFTCHSKSLAIFLMRVDYAGIAAMIVTSFFPPVYYVFQCTPVWQWIYLSTISVMGVMTVGVLFAPSCQSSRYRPFRAFLFMSMGASGLIPALHGVITNWHEPMCGVTLAYEGVMAGSYAIGTMIYVVRIPERWKPGMFDLGGHSHNLFHILVIAGACAHYKAALLFLEWRDNYGCGI